VYNEDGSIGSDISWKKRVDLGRKGRGGVREERKTKCPGLSQEIDDEEQS